MLVATFVLVAVLFRDLGFERRTLSAATFGTETREIFSAGVQFGWHDRVVRPLLFVSAVGGVFFMYGFYSWQPYVLGLLGKNAVWTLGIVQAGLSLTGIAGNALVKPIMRAEPCRRDPARVLAWTSVAGALLVFGVAAVGLLTREPGVVPFAIAIVLWLPWGVVFGVAGPVSQAYLNEHIPSAQRATVLSLDAFFGDVGGGVGQPALGWVSQQASIAVGWLVGGGVRRLDGSALRDVGARGGCEEGGVGGGSSEGTSSAWLAVGFACSCRAWCPGWDSNPHEVSPRGF